MTHTDHARLGSLDWDNDTWKGQVAVPMGTLCFGVEAEFEGPTSAQLDLLVEVVDRFAEFWPLILDKIAELHNKNCKMTATRPLNPSELEAIVPGHYVEIPLESEMGNKRWLYCCSFDKRAGCLQYTVSF